MPAVVVWFCVAYTALQLLVLSTVLAWVVLRVRSSRPRRGGYVKLAVSTGTSRSTGTASRIGAATRRAITAACRSTWGRGRRSRRTDSPLTLRVRPYLSSSRSPTSSGLRIIDGGAATNGRDLPPHAA